MSWLDGISSSLMTKSLDGLWARQSAIRDNLANVDTPNYKRKYVSFEEQLKSAISNIEKTKSQTVSEINNTQSCVGVANDETLRIDGNNVNSEFENIELARTQLQYSAVTQQLNSYYARMRTAISGGVR